MKRLLVALVAAAWIAIAAGTGTAPAAHAKTCSAGYVHANLSWGEKCLKVGQYCKIKGDREYHRYRFHCHTGRLSRSASGGNQAATDLNCSDIAASKKPIRVTGSDPYRLDGDGDGWGCEP
jgi:hypothetical protein